MARKKGKGKGGKAAKFAKAKAKKKAAAAARASPAPEPEHDTPVWVDAQEDGVIGVRDVHIPNLHLAKPGGGGDLLVGTDLVIAEGNRYGMIGRNGIGKSTLLKKLASYTLPAFPRHLRVLYVRQELEGNQLSVVQTVVRSDEERLALLKEQAKLREEIEAGEDRSARMEEIVERLDYIGADTAHTRAAQILSGLGFSEAMQQVPTQDLSGGWRMRVSLAAALFIAPDVLLLDEPTNHLDLPAVLWLQDYLQCYEKSVVVVSHDRTFLNDVCTHIIHIEKKKLVYYKGNYDMYEEVRSQKMKQHAIAYKKQQHFISHNEAFVRKFGANKKWASLAQSRAKILEKMDRLTAWVDESYFKFSFPEPEPLRKKAMISMDDVTFGYFGEDRSGKTYLLKNMELRIDWGDVIGVLGPNGAGKSTLMNLIMQKLKPVKGVVVHNKAMRVGYFAQHHMDTLELDKTPYAYLMKLFPQATNQQIFAKLGQFGLAEKARTQTIGTLSGGEKSRIAFAVLTWDAPHLLILDEPTNHLDLGTIQSLIRAIQAWNGSLMIVSHDQYFLNAICNEFWAVGDQKCRPFQTFQEAKTWCYNKKRKHVGVVGRDGQILSEKKGADKLNLDEIMGAIDEVADAVANPFSTASMVDEVLKQEERDAALRKKAALARKKKAKAVPTEKAVFNEKMLPQVQKFVDQEMPPDKMLRRLQVWTPTEGDRDAQGVCDRLTFAMWRAYWEERCPVDDSTLLDSWCPLLQHVAPRSHPSMQRSVITACVSIWATAVSEERRRAVEEDSLVNCIQNVYFQDILSEASLLSWRDDDTDKTKGRAEALSCLSEWIGDLE